jgi:hypothetical protein
MHCSEIADATVSHRALPVCAGEERGRDRARALAELPLRCAEAMPPPGIFSGSTRTIRAIPVRPLSISLGPYDLAPWTHAAALGRRALVTPTSLMGLTRLRCGRGLPRSTAFVTSSQDVVPVTLPPGRARLWIRPCPIGSPAWTMTMGMLAVACRAATVAEAATETNTSTGSGTSSRANSGRRSNRPWA